MSDTDVHTFVQRCLDSGELPQVNERQRAVVEYLMKGMQRGAQLRVVHLRNFSGFVFDDEWPFVGEPLPRCAAEVLYDGVYAGVQCSRRAVELHDMGPGNEELPLCTQHLRILQRRRTPLYILRANEREDA